MADSGWYCKVDGVTGSVTKQGYSGCFQLSTFGLSVDLNAEYATEGLKKSGNAKASPIMMSLDDNGAGKGALFSKIMKADEISSITVTGVTDDKVNVKYELSNCYITASSAAMDNRGEFIIPTVMVIYKQMKFTPYSANTTGQWTAGASVTYDATTGQTT
jgi:Type VI secretion system effector, Hcp